MKEPFTFYKALDPQKGSWDGYGIFPIGQDDFLAYVTDAPSAASIHTPELIKNFWTDHLRTSPHSAEELDLAKVELADSINQLQYFLQKRGRTDGGTYQATFCVARKSGANLLFCCIGDSVLQLLRHKKLYRLTTEEIWEGQLVIGESRNLKERQRTKPIRFIGESGDFVDPALVQCLRLNAGDKLILVTDGFEDLLSPDRLLPLMQMDAELLRQELERAVTKIKPKDDITLISISADVPVAFDPKKEIESLQSKLISLESKQNQFHNELAQTTLPAARLDRLERSLQQFSKQVQELTKRLDHSRNFRVMQPSPSHRKPFAIRTAFLAIVAAFIIGAVSASAFFLYKTDREHAVAAPAAASRPPQALRQSSAPPEIPQISTCAYTVKKGDTLEKIALEKQITMPSLLELNPAIHKDSALKIGQILTICKEGV